MSNPPPYSAVRGPQQPPPYTGGQPPQQQPVLQINPGQPQPQVIGVGQQPQPQLQAAQQQQQSPQSIQQMQAQIQAQIQALQQQQLALQQAQNSQQPIPQIQLPQAPPPQNPQQNVVFLKQNANGTFEQVTLTPEQQQRISLQQPGGANAASPGGASAAPLLVGGQHSPNLLNSSSAASIGNGSSGAFTASGSLTAMPSNLMGGSTTSMSSSMTNPAVLASVPPPSPAWGVLPPNPNVVVGQLPPAQSNLNLSTSRSPGHSTTTRPAIDTRRWGFALTDAYHQTLQRVPVPPSVVRPTRGIQSYNADVAASSTKPCGSAICLRYTGHGMPSDDRECDLGENCTSFHVDPEYMERARRTADSLCCAIHNDYFSQEMIKSNCAAHITSKQFVLIMEDRSEIELLPSQLCLTVGLDSLVARGNQLIINKRKHICRLHLEGKCKWTKDCGHVHLCRELHRYIQQFHYPSLVFLLTTESNSNVIAEKVRSGNAILDFFSSRASLPLMGQLIEAKKIAALQALISCGACCTSEQVDGIAALGIKPPSDSKVIGDLRAPVAPQKVSTPQAQLSLGSVSPARMDTSHQDVSLPSFSPGSSITTAPPLPGGLTSGGVVGGNFSGTDHPLNTGQPLLPAGTRTQSD